MKLEISSRRDVLLGAALSVLAPHVRAQSYPTKPVRLVAPYSPGSGADTTARLIAPKLQEGLGETVGAGGVIGDETVAKALIGKSMRLPHRGVIPSEARDLWATA